LYRERTVLNLGWEAGHVKIFRNFAQFHLASAEVVQREGLCISMYPQLLVMIYVTSKIQSEV